MNSINQNPRLWLISLVMISTILHVSSHSDSPVPFGWEDMCTVTPHSDVMTQYGVHVTEHVTHMECTVTSDNRWKLQKLRHRLAQIDTSSHVVFVSVSCQHVGTLSLPWPMKARGLVGLVVSECLLEGRYDEFGDASVEAIPEQLMVLDIQDSVWLRDDAGFKRLSSPGGLANMSTAYDCGHDSTLVFMSTRNVSDAMDSMSGSMYDGLDLGSLGDIDMSGILDFPTDASSKVNVGDLLHNQDNIKPAGNNMTSASINNTSAGKPSSELTDLLDQLMSLVDLKCNYSKLRLLDESMSAVMPVHHFRLLVQGASYPSLEELNYARSAMREVPEELLQPRNYFPKLMRVDLSYNDITEVTLPSQGNDTFSVADTPVVLDISYNRISSLNISTVKNWASNTEVFVNVSGNPIDCSTELLDIAHILSSTNNKDDLYRYRYLLDITCCEKIQGQTQSLHEFYNASTQSTAGLDFGITIGICVVAALCAIALAALVVVLFTKHNQLKAHLDNNTVDGNDSHKTGSFISV